jgi:uncharacterized sulfatase
VLDNQTDWRNNPRIERTLPELFREHGYETVSAGKVFHTSKADESRWSLTLKPKRFARDGRKRVEGGSKTTSLPVIPSGHFPLIWGVEGEELVDQIDGRVAETVAQFLEERPEDGPPLFLAVGLTKPHSPYLAPKPYMGRIDPLQIELPASPADDWGDIPKAALDGAITGRDLDPEVWKKIIQAYYACGAYMDACVGRILEGLRASGRQDRTIVVFTGDHGQLLGEHGLWFKGRLFEEALACPLLVVTPDGRGAGASCAALIELVDVFPTLVELAGLPLPEDCEGTSLVPLLTDPGRAWKRGAFSQTPGGSSLRTEEWRLNLWDSGDVELYDHRNDPGEFVNRARDADSAQSVAELRKLLEAGWRGARPPG